MSKSKSIKKSVAYKRATFHKPIKGQTLQHLLSSAVTALPTVKLRKRSASDADDSPMVHLIGGPAPTTAFATGFLASYSPGTAPLGLRDDEDAVDIQFELMTLPKTEDGKARELVDSRMFFAVHKNHVVIMQTQSLRSAQLETQINWMLRQAKVMGEDNFVSLIDKPSPAVAKKIAAAKGVRAITLSNTDSLRARPGTALATAPGVVPVSTSLVKSAGATKVGPGGAVIDMLKSLIGVDKAASLDLDALEQARVELTVTLKVYRQTTDEGQKLLEDLGGALRHADNEHLQTEIELLDGERLKGDDLKVIGKVSVHTNSGHLDSGEVYEAMRQWLLEKLQTGSIAG